MNRLTIILLLSITALCVIGRSIKKQENFWNEKVDITNETEEIPDPQEPDDTEENSSDPKELFNVEKETEEPEESKEYEVVENTIEPFQGSLFASI